MLTRLQTELLQTQASIACQSEMEAKLRAEVSRATYRAAGTRADSVSQATAEVQEAHAQIQAARQELKIKLNRLYEGAKHEFEQELKRSQDEVSIAAGKLEVARQEQEECKERSDQYEIVIDGLREELEILQVSENSFKKRYAETSNSLTVTRATSDSRCSELEQEKTNAVAEIQILREKHSDELAAKDAELQAVDKDFRLCKMELESLRQNKVCMDQAAQIQGNLAGHLKASQSQDAIEHVSAEVTAGVTRDEGNPRPRQRKKANRHLLRTHSWVLPLVTDREEDTPRETPRSRAFSQLSEDLIEETQVTADYGLSAESEFFQIEPQSQHAPNSGHRIIRAGLLPPRTPEVFTSAITATSSDLKLKRKAPFTQSDDEISSPHVSQSSRRVKIKDSQEPSQTRTAAAGNKSAQFLRPMAKKQPGAMRPGSDKTGVGQKRGSTRSTGYSTSAANARFNACQSGPPSSTPEA